MEDAILAAEVLRNPPQAMDRYIPRSMDDHGDYAGLD